MKIIERESIKQLGPLGGPTAAFLLKAVRNVATAKSLFRKALKVLMKTNLKLLIPLLIIALTFASPQAIYGMEDFSNPDEQDLKRPYSSMDSDITEYPSIQNKRGGEQVRENTFQWCPKEIKFKILEYVAIDYYLGYGNTGSLGVVCQDWRRIIEQDEMKESIVYQRFLKGVLIYRPKNPQSDVGRIDLPIAALSNPLEGTFDLSQCGDTGQYLSISTGYRKEIKAENIKKLEIWLIPKFLIGRELNTTAKHFQEIYGSWNDNAPVGIFWTWRDNLEAFDYLITENYDILSNKSLSEKYWKDAGRSHPTGRRGGPSWSRMSKFHVHF